MRRWQDQRRHVEHELCERTLPAKQPRAVQSAACVPLRLQALSERGAEPQLVWKGGCGDRLVLSEV